jgi:hypothetical protein
LGRTRISDPIDQVFHALIAELLSRSFDPPVYSLDYSFGIIALKRSALDVGDESLLISAKLLQTNIFDVGVSHGFLVPFTRLISNSAPRRRQTKPVGASGLWIT